jgi:glycosyltransferase involved in cell wall biosynthesis
MLATQLARQHEIQIISYHKQYPGWLYPGKTDKDTSRKPLKINAVYLIDSLNPYTWWKTGRYICKFSPDLLIAQWWVTFMAPSLLWISRMTRKRGIPLLTIVHNVLPHEEHWWDRILARVALHKLGRFIVHSPEERKRLHRLIPNAQVAVTPFPKFESLKENNYPQDEARRFLKVPAGNPVILFFGIVRPYKGLDVLLDALALLRDGGTLVSLIVAGEFWSDIKPYLNQMDRLKLRSQVRIENRYIPNEEVALYFSAANILVAPYSAGTQSASAALGLAFGLPIILTQHIARGLDPQCKDQVKVIPPKDPRALAEAIAAMVSVNGQIRKLKATVHYDSWQALGETISSFSSE